MLGDYLQEEILLSQIQNHTGVPLRKMDLAGKLGSNREPMPGRFDLAIALAIRGNE